jgi:hypothetical protein
MADQLDQEHAQLQATDTIPTRLATRLRCRAMKRPS